MIVVDASVLASALLGDGESGRASRALLRGQELSLPDLADVEVASVIRRRWRAGAIALKRYEAAIADLMDLPAERFPARPLLPRILELRDNFSSYDANYVALAELLQCPLYTGDRRLASAAGARCDVLVLPV